MRPLGDLRLRLALPFAVLTGPGRVHLVAGEDVRYLLEGPELEDWLPQLLSGLDGRQSAAELVTQLPEARRDEALEVLARLVAERVLAPAEASAAHRAARRRLLLAGEGQVRRALESDAAGGEASAEPLRVLCQGTLDYAALEAFNAERLSQGDPYLWVSTGPLTRSFVSPVLLPDAGPCLMCLVAAFRRLSPVPELYDALTSHGRAGAGWPECEVPAPAVGILRALVSWKVELMRDAMPSAALYRLHVLSHDTLEVSSHRVTAEPDCSSCGASR